MAKTPEEPKHLAAIGRVFLILWKGPDKPGGVAKDTTIYWEFAADKKKVAFVPGEFVVPNKEAPQRFKLVDVIRDAPDVSRWRILYDVYEVPGDATKVRRAELLHGVEHKQSLRPGDCVLPVPWPEYPEPPSTEIEK